MDREIDIQIASEMEMCVCVYVCVCVRVCVCIYRASPVIVKFNISMKTFHTAARLKCVPG